MCVGVSTYSEQSGLGSLDNPVRDAEAVFKETNKRVNCRAAIVRNPADTETILQHLRHDFLKPLDEFDPTEHGTFAAGRRYAPHAKAVLSHADAPVSPNVAHLAFQLGCFYFKVAFEFADARRMLRRSLSVCRALGGHGRGVVRGGMLLHCAGLVVL